MKLLFDENLSPKVPALEAAHFPGSVHVRECRLIGKSDEDVWGFARTNGFTIISKGSDFQQRSFLYGAPPKIVWLRIGNCTRGQIVQLITTHAPDILALDADSLESGLVLA